MKLFIPEASLDDMTWSVPPPSLTEAREKYDTSFSIAYLDSLKSSLPKAASDTIHVLPSSENLPSTSAYTKEAKTQVDDSLILRAIHEARITKTAAEIELIRTANSISSRAHETVMRVLGRAVKLGLRSTSDTGVVTLPGDWLIEKEAEAEALFVAACRREGLVPFLHAQSDGYILIYMHLGLFIKHIYLSAHLLIGLRLCTIAAMEATTKSLHGVPYLQPPRQTLAL